LGLGGPREAVRDFLFQLWRIFNGSLEELLPKMAGHGEIVHEAANDYKSQEKVCKVRNITFIHHIYIIYAPGELERRCKG
jgi:hypothetical protein